MRLYTACGVPFWIDDDDYELVKHMTFSYVGKYIGAWDGKKRYCLHRVLMPLSECDHIDGDVRNNRRSNLRYVTRSQNMQNRENWGRLPKGISYDDAKGLYRARIQVNGRRISLGRHKKLQDAVDAYNEAARRYYGEHACLSVMEMET
jgi:hypothetical protein